MTRLHFASSKVIFSDSKSDIVCHCHRYLYDVDDEFMMVWTVDVETSRADVIFEVLRPCQLFVCFSTRDSSLPG